jgi:hypothetical protein
MLLDLLDRPGRCSGSWWPHDGEVAGGAVADSTLVIFRFGATLELGRSGRAMMMMMMMTASASGDGGVAGSLSEVQRATGSSTAIAEFCSTDGRARCVLYPLASGPEESGAAH